MKALVLSSSGGPELFKTVSTRPIPQIIPDHALIKIKAFGLNRTECHARQGFAGKNIVWPRIIGIECVGIIEKIGPLSPSKQEDNSYKSKYSELQIGSYVCALMGGMGRAFDGSYAQYTLVPLNIIHLIHSSFIDTGRITWKTLGAIPEMFQTANGSLKSLRFFESLDKIIKEREVADKVNNKKYFILIRGATSSIGLCAISIIKAFTNKNKIQNVFILGTTRNNNKIDYLKSIGVDQVIIENENYSIKNEITKVTEGELVDAALELVGTVSLKDSIHSTKSHGFVCMTGCLGGWSLEAIEDVYSYFKSTVAFMIYGGNSDSITSVELNDFIGLVASGSISLSLDENDYTLETVWQAHERMENNQAKGKIVVVNP